jgi:hypothetical protein
MQKHATASVGKIPSAKTMVRYVSDGEGVPSSVLVVELATVHPMKEGSSCSVASRRVKAFSAGPANSHAA